MPVKIYIPTALRQYARNSEAVEVSGDNVGAAMADLTNKHPELKQHLYNDQGKLRSFVNLYVNDEDIRYKENEETPVSGNDEISIIPSIAGGSALLDQANEEVTLSNEEVARYSRHLIMPEVGMAGQKKLKAASVLAIGAGGLGAPLTMYLAAAGVGRLGLVDFDVVDASNLQRQVIHGTKDIGRPKLDSARDRLLDINPFIKFEGYQTALSSENALDLFKNYDIIIDGTDNFPTRYLVNDACVLLGKPNVYGSIFRFEGQASVFYAEQGPCYRCLYPEPPPPGLVPSCAEGGVLGILPGIIGVIQATEAVKLIIGEGTSLVGRLLLFDALKMKFRELKLRKNPDCPICGTHRTITQLIDYQEFCGMKPAETQAETQKDNMSSNTDWEITPQQLKERLDRGDKITIIDVREPHEWQIANLEKHGAKLIPLGTVPDRVGELNKDDETVVHCKMGGRSAKAYEFLKQTGFNRVQNLRGGITAWADTVDPSMPKY